MEIEKNKSIIESILFAAGKEVKNIEISNILEISISDVDDLLESMINDYKSVDRGIEIIKIKNSYQMTTKKENYEYIYEFFDNVNIPKLSQAAIEILSVIAYNPKISKPEIESVRGVNSDGTMYKLLEYGLVEESGKLDILGKPMSYSVSNKFLKMFGLESLKDLPTLPKFRLDENEQIILEEYEKEIIKNLEEKKNEIEPSGI